MDDFEHLEKTVVRELSCRLCMCNDVSKLKPLSAELKRKIKRLFDIVVRSDDSLPKAICYDCFQQVVSMHLYTVKVNKTQKYLDFHKQKQPHEEKPNPNKLSEIQNITLQEKKQNLQNIYAELEKQSAQKNMIVNGTSQQQGDTKVVKPHNKKVSPVEQRFLESLTLEEFACTEKLDKNTLFGNQENEITVEHDCLNEGNKSPTGESISETLDPLVLINGRPAKQGAALDKQITLFYKMECCICHEKGFHFRSLMKHYKERHGVPGYVTCCNKKIHYFYSKKIIEHMAYHLQPNVFMCRSCHQNFQSSQELSEHQANGGRSEGKVLCPRCTEKYPTYKELGRHLATHRTADKSQCDYCAKLFKHHHRKKCLNNMEDVILCTTCTRLMKTIEKQEKEIKEKIKKTLEVTTKQKKFKQALPFSDEEASTD